MMLYRNNPKVGQSDMGALGMTGLWFKFVIPLDGMSFSILCMMCLVMFCIEMAYAYRHCLQHWDGVILRQLTQQVLLFIFVLHTMLACVSI